MTTFSLTGIILLVLEVLALGFALFALVHAVRQRPDAFTAVGKQTKPIWVGILVVAVALILLSGFTGFLGIIGVVAVGVYLADVRPKVDDVQRGPRW